MVTTIAGVTRSPPSQLTSSHMSVRDTEKYQAKLPGRPRSHATDEERAEARRLRVRRNVQAFRQRQREKKLLAITGDTGLPASSTASAPPDTDTKDEKLTSENDSHPPKLDKSQRNSIIVRSRPYLSESYSSLQVDVNPGLTYVDGFIGALQEKYLPQSVTVVRMRYDPTSSLNLNCAGWNSTAALQVGDPGSNLMAHALLSSAVNVIGRYHNDDRLSVHGTALQTTALRRYSHALQKFQSGAKIYSRDILRLTAMIFAISELLSNGSWQSCERHLEGAAALIEFDGAENMANAAASAHYHGFRVLQACTAFAFHRDSFLAKPEWINFPGKDQYEDASKPVQLMLDAALPLLPDLHRNARPHTGYSRSQLLDMLKTCNTVASALDKWQVSMEVRYKSLNQPLYFPMPAAWPGLYDTSLFFVDLDIAVAFMLYTGIRIKLANLMIDLFDQLAMFDTAYSLAAQGVRFSCLTWARLSCRCHEYFYRPEAMGTGRIICLFPFDAAWQSFVRLQSDLDGSIDLSQELRWCRNAAERFYALDVPMISWRDGQMPPHRSKSRFSDVEVNEEPDRPIKEEPKESMLFGVGEDGTDNSPPEPP